VEPLAADLIRHHRAIDETVIVPKGWLKSLGTMRKLRERLRSFRFDWAVDPQSLTKSSMLAWLSGARRRVGFARPQGRELAPWLNNVRVARGDAHLVDASLKLLAPLSIELRETRFDVPTHVDAEVRVDRFVRDAHLLGGFAVLNSAASWRSKQWPADRFGRVARYLGEMHELPSVVTWAGSREAAIARQIVIASGGHAMCAPSTSLLELASLLRHARFVIASDTGPLHLAAATGTPCIGLFGPTRAEKSGPYGAQHISIQIDCQRIRNRRRRREDDTALRRITVESVCDACDQMLRRPHSEDTKQTHAA
jgi:ADP-heptose:LPS heptosyltransferase